MERYSVEAATLVDFYAEGTLLGTVFGEIERELKTQNQVVCQFIIDGIVLREDDEKRFARIPISSIQKLEYLAESGVKVAMDVLKSWIEGIPDLQAQAEAIATRTRADGWKLSLGSIQQLITNVQTLTGSLISLKITLGDSITGSAIPWRENEMRMMHCIRESIAAAEKKNYKLLADILEYDLINTLEIWKRDLTILKNFLNGEGSNKTHATVNDAIEEQSLVDRRRQSN